MTDYFFPYQTPDVMQLEERLRHVTFSLDEQNRLEIFEIVSHLGSTFVPTIFSTENDLVIAHQYDRQIFFPSPTPVKILSHALSGYEEWLRRKYCLPGFVEVEPDDIVVDCGAYVAGFSLNAVKVARAVHAFEPDTQNFKCMAENFKGIPNITLNNVGLYSSTNKMPLNVSSSSVEHSLLAPDDGHTIEIREIQVYSLYDYCKKNSIYNLDFVKIEAEGVELEVFDGLGDIRPLKLAIDVSPERNG